MWIYDICGSPLTGWPTGGKQEGTCSLHLKQPFQPQPPQLSPSATWLRWTCPGRTCQPRPRFCFGASLSCRVQGCSGLVMDGWKTESHRTSQTYWVWSFHWLLEQLFRANPRKARLPLHLWRLSRKMMISAQCHEGCFQNQSTKLRREFEPQQVLGIRFNSESTTGTWGTTLPGASPRNIAAACPDTWTPTHWWSQQNSDGWQSHACNHTCIREEKYM